MEQFRNIPSTLSSSAIYTIEYLWRPTHLFLMGEIAPSWMLIRSILVELDQDEDGSYIMSNTQFGIYGCGDTVFEAQQDFIITLIDYYQLLAERAEREPLTRIEFLRLQLYIDRTPTATPVYAKADHERFATMYITESYISASQYYFHAT